MQCGSRAPCFSIWNCAPNGPTSPECDVSILRVAREIGYESEAAFKPGVQEGVWSAARDLAEAGGARGLGGLAYGVRHRVPSGSFGNAGPRHFLWNILEVPGCDPSEANKRGAICLACGGLRAQLMR